MAFLYLVGSNFNKLKTASSVTMSSVNATYPATNLYDDNPGSTARFTSAGANDNVVVDLSASPPSIDFVSLHGFKLFGLTSLELHSSATGSFAGEETLEKTISGISALAPPSVWGKLSAPKSVRYWRLRAPGTATSPMEWGEMVLGLSSSLSRTAVFPHEEREATGHIRHEGIGRTVYAVKMVEHSSREHTFHFVQFRTQMETFRDQLWSASNRGVDPLVVVLDDTAAPRDTYFGTFIPDSFSWTANGPIYEWSVGFKESPFGVTAS